MPAIEDAARFYQAGQRAEAEQACRDILADRPHDFDALHLLGVLRIDAGDPAEALALLRRAETIRSQDAQLQFHIGLAHVALKEPSLAAVAYRAALAANPEHVGALNNLSGVLLDLRRFPEAVDTARRAVRASPTDPQGYYNLGRALAAADMLDEAMLTLRSALVLAKGIAPPDRIADVVSALCGALASQRRYDEIMRLCRTYRDLTGDQRITWNESLALLIQGQYAEGWQAYECRFDVPDHDPRRPGSAVLDLDQVKGKHVLVFNEQGRGDMLHFARYLPLLAERGATVIVEMYADLCPLFRLIDGVSEVVPEDMPLPPHDVSTPLMSLPAAFRTTLETIPAQVPYLRVADDQLAAWRGRLGARTRPRVGLAWWGSQYSPRSSMPPAMLEPLLRQDSIAFHSLQKTLPDEQFAWLSAQPGLTDHHAALGDFSDTAALISHLDLVISIDTSVAHLAGGLGVPVWIMLPYAPDWRWLHDREDSPWYPTARLFRQATPGNWPGVIARVAAALDTWTSR